MLGRVRASTSGNGPPLIEKVWYSPGSIPAPASAVQVISVTASLTWLPCTSIGGLIAVFVIVAVQPATGLVRTEASGVSAGGWNPRLVGGGGVASVGPREGRPPQPPRPAA